MPTRLRRWLADLALPPADVGLALVFTVASLSWILLQPHVGQTTQPFSDLSGGPAPPLPPVGVQHANGPVINLVPTLALALRRRLPVSAFVIALAGVLIPFQLQDGVALAWPGFLAILILAYSLVTYGRYLAGSAALLLIGALVAAADVTSSTPPLPPWLGLLAIFGPVGLAGAAMRSARARTEAVAQQAASLEREKEASARAAVAEERARVARELHDVVSHHVSVMVIQAGAAGKVIESRPDLAASALASIEESGREAMSELRQLLGVVAPLDDLLHPLPGLHSLDALVGAVREAGQPVTLTQEIGAVPRDVELAAYRVVQEGLTNALRYAPGAPTSVHLSRVGDDLVVEVRNDRPAGAASTVGTDVGVGSRAGLIGLTERLRLHDGTLDAGRRLDGGFRITARIPLPTAPVPAEPA